MLDAFRYIKGSLLIRVWGFSPERFMNLCSNKGILLWNIRKVEDAYLMNISIQGFYQLKEIARKTGTKVAILKRYGLPFFIPVVKKRVFFLIGLCMAVSFWAASSLFVWEIELNGNRQITDDSFMTFLHENGIKVGMLQKDLDIEHMEKEIRKNFSPIIWVSAKMNGTKLIIETKENDTILSGEQEGAIAFADLVSEYNGKVISIIVREGIPQVSTGSEVEEGTILVSGKVPVYNDDATIREYQTVRADADIILEHWISHEDQLSFYHVEQEYTGRIDKTPYIRLGSKELRVPKEPSFLVYDSLIRESRPLLFEKLSLPIFWGEYVTREYQKTEHKYTQEEAKLLLQEKINIFLSSLQEKGVQIIEKDVKIDTYGETWIAQCDLCVWEHAGSPIPIMDQSIGENATYE